MTAKAVLLFAVQLTTLTAFLAVLLALPVELSALMEAPAQPVRVGVAGADG